MTLSYTHLETAWGRMLALADNNALCGLYFDDQKNRPSVAHQWTLNPELPIFIALREYLDQYTLNPHNALTNTNNPVNTPFTSPPFTYKFITGTPFAHRVWHAIATVPAGTTISYRELAHKIGAGNNYARAVAAATGRNPLSIIIPCHRIIGLNGSLTGYAGGLERKRALLDHAKLNQ